MGKMNCGMQNDKTVIYINLSIWSENDIADMIKRNALFYNFHD